MANFTPVSAAIGGALIGLAAVLLMLFTGRIAGISGIAGGLFNPRTDDRLWRLAFIAGLIAAPLAAALVGHAVPMPQMPASMITIAVAGLLVGFGTRLGNGCTSGHGICGIARLSPRSIAATVVFMVAAIIVVALDASRDRRLSHAALASLICGFIFGSGLVISQHGADRRRSWAFSTCSAFRAAPGIRASIVVMAAGLVVTGIGLCADPAAHAAL